MFAPQRKAKGIIDLHQNKFGKKIDIFDVIQQVHFIPRIALSILAIEKKSSKDR